jgi:lipid A 3-O-deacylase
LGEADATSIELRRLLFYPAAVALISVTAAGNVRAQQLLSMGARADNDAFDFWLPPYARPDEEYTSGVRASLTYAGPALWDRWFHTSTASCANGAVRCATHTYSFGQDIYTGKLAPGDTSLLPGTRPNAGWLYIMESSRAGTKDRLDESSVTVGITGPEALGEFTQREFHAIAPSFNRPIDWAMQLPFEPGIVLAYDHTERLLALGEGDSFSGDVEPHAGASLGNILTEARAGLRVRSGFHLTHPWLMAAESSRPEISFFADGTIHAVARNEFLAGTMFRSSAHVQERPFVSEGQVGVTAKWRRVSATYSVDRTASEYVTRATGHTWSRIAVEWRMGR